jgi:glycosyltransferase involved in cell wall biosynthesis
MTPYIVVPCLNEVKHLSHSLQELLHAGYRNVVVVDDGSTDNTYRIAQSFPVHVLRHLVNVGQGAALRTGIEYALRQNAEAVVTFDSDGQHRVEDIAKLMSVLEAGYEVALGSRYIHREQHVPLTKKYLIHKPAILVNWFFTGLMLSDAHNGFRAFNRHAAESIRLNQPEMAHATEIIAEITRNKLKYQEVPVEIIYNHYGRSFRTAIKVLADLFNSKMFS